MKLYPLFLLMATATVLSPGPGVVMTLSNALKYGLQGAFGGILGVACGALVVAAISATSVGVILATSALAFTLLKFIGAAYLIYLGIRAWRTPAFAFQERSSSQAGFGRRFMEGISLQLTNPKAIFFFLSVLPQFIDPAMRLYRTVFSAGTDLQRSGGCHPLHVCIFCRAGQNLACVGARESPVEQISRGNLCVFRRRAGGGKEVSAAK